jgi:hypothetical protein
MPHSLRELRFPQLVRICRRMGWLPTCRIFAWSFGAWSFGAWSFLGHSPTVALEPARD